MTERTNIPDAKVLKGLPWLEYINLHDLAALTTLHALIAFRGIPEESMYPEWLKETAVLCYRMADEMVAACQAEESEIPVEEQS